MGKIPSTFADIVRILNSKLRRVQHLQRSECCATCRSRLAPHDSRLLLLRTDGLRFQPSLIQNMTQKEKDKRTSTFQWCFLKAARTGLRRASPALASPPDSTITCTAPHARCIKALSKSSIPSYYLKVENNYASTYRQALGYNSRAY